MQTVADRRLNPITLDATRDAAVILAARGLRAFADGFVSVILPVYLAALGLDALHIGAISTATLLGSAALTLSVGLVAYRVRRRRVLFAASLVMAATGLGFAWFHSFWPLVLVAVIGTLNPSNGDVSVFLPVEQALLPQTVSDKMRTALFARYALAGSLLGAMGSLAAAVPSLLHDRASMDMLQSLQAMFVLYGVIGLLAFLLYRGLSPSIDDRASRPEAPLGESKGRVYTLAGLFSIDAFGGGFIVQSLLALWLFERFHLSLAAAGTIFFWSGLLTAMSYLIAARLAGRFGLINTMVFSHLPANVFLMLMPLMPSLPLALALLMARSLLSQMDVPTRTSYVMAVVTPAERPAAAGVTSVPRSLASAASPLLSGYMLGLSSFGWPLIVAGGLKAIYDLLLLAMFAKVRPPEEQR
jgi:MFS family permease